MVSRVAIGLGRSWPNSPWLVRLGVWSGPAGPDAHGLSRFVLANRILKSADDPYLPVTDTVQLRNKEKFRQDRQRLLRFVCLETLVS